MPAENRPHAPEPPEISAVARALASRTPGEPVPELDIPRAAVALLLRPGAQGLELLLIRRADREGDPWSGHMALPGGREQPEDAVPEETAARESRAEVGIDVYAGGRLLGALDPVWPRSSRAPRVLVRPFVFAVPGGVRPVPNEEVDAAVWIPLHELRAPGAVTEHLLEMDGIGEMSFPALGARGYVIWGLTRRILSDFLALGAG
jgi:8-oxo-dGTP pyrophosphatase MutT (NUDIX family)